ncbi:glycosyltransferase family 4 protein [Streptomyces sp. UNOC14_S4]|uniref:glycosyltransferase family 4 protein n=1 Tax=Streptomyces sp. UNOC14_S4 TaxID=2872340 RepID=UPI001E5C2968|nr:glycosyltransferase family 4 protein [Streptomyces sp. UNOC14_S4]MCC3768952.1 glycosyltransferase family 4 protein [Streptomyces sp. UNOC14_S4]
MADKRYRILVVSDISGMGGGGIPVFNQHLTEALAKEHDVTLFTADPGTQPHQGARMVSTPPIPEGVEDRVWMEFQSTLDPRTHGLPDPQERPFDLIVGHSRFSGPAAAELRDRWYPDAKVAHFLHTSPERLAEVKYAHDPAHAQTKATRDSRIEREVMDRADVVVGVGPLLTTEAERLSSAGQHVPDSHQLVPGVKIEELVQRGPHEGRLNLLVMGRTDDPLKGVNDALRAVKMLNNNGVDVHLTIRGAAPEKLDEIVEAAEMRGGKGNVTVKPFTKDGNELKNDIIGADAVIMPSKHEGFGLVATEAAGHGVPILVNQESGAAQFLGDKARIAPGIGQPCIVPEPSDPNDRPLAWAKSIGQLKADLPQRRENAAQLREALKAYSWDHASEALVEAAMQATPQPQQKPLAQGQAQRKATVQGPDGKLLGTGAAAKPAAPPGPQSALARAAAMTSPGVRPAAPAQPQPAAARPYHLPPTQGPARGR